MARRSSQTPLQRIIQFFLTAPLAEIRQGIEVGQEIVNHRLAGGETATPARRTRPTVPIVTKTVALTDEQIQSLPVSGPTIPVAPKPRRKRADAGKPRGSRQTASATSPTPAPPATAANGPVRRSRPVILPPPTIVQSEFPAELPDQAVDPAGDVE